MFPHIKRVGLAIAAVVACLAACSQDKPLTGCATACPDGLVCDLPSGTCVPPAPTDAGIGGCAQDLDCAAPTARCDVSRHACVQCVTGTDCESGGCNAGVCLPFPDRCEVAQKLVIGTEPVVVESTTAGQGDDKSLSCAIGEGAPDLVYDLFVDTRSRLNIAVTAKEGSALQPVIAVQTACATDASGGTPDELGCRWAPPGESTATLAVDVPAGHSFLWIDADTGSSGAFRLEVSAEQAKLGDSCAQPRPIELQNDAFSIDASTTGFHDDFDTTCGAYNGLDAPDNVYALTLTAAQRVQVKVTPKSNGFLPLVYLRRPGACDDSSSAAQVECGEPLPGLGASLEVPNLEAGTYFLVVDGDIDEAFQPTSGDYHLDVKVSPPLALAVNDKCSGAVPLQLPSAGTLSVKADTFSAYDDTTTPCGGSGADIVYTFSIPSPVYFEARVTATTSNGFLPVVALRTNCESEDVSSLVTCGAATQVGGSAVVTRGNLPAGTYFLWIDGDHQSRGGFTLDFTTAAPVLPPANDSCQKPGVLTPSLGTVTVSGTTLGANDDSYSCDYPYGAATPDVVYALTVPVQSSLSFDVQAAQGSTLRPVLYMDEGTCAFPSGETFCAWGDPSSADRVVHTEGSVAPGTYYVWVDGDFTSSGAFTLKAELGPPVAPPTNDDCGSAAPLSASGASVTGDTRSADDTTSGFCESWTGGSGEEAGDVAYNFSTTAMHTAVIQVTPDSADGKLFRPAVYVRGSGSATCASIDPSVQQGCAIASKIGGAVTLTLPNLPAGNWTVWVDGVGKTTGKFALSLSLQ